MSDPTRYAETAACAFCDTIATKQCDGVLAWLGDGGKYDSRAIRFRCDRNLCKSCATNLGHIHFAFESGHEFDTYDYCPECIKEGRTFHESEPVFVTSEDEGLALVRRRNFNLAIRPLGNPVKELLI